MADAPAPVRVELLDVELGRPTTIDRVRTYRIEMAPGQPAGRHRHPCDVVGIVVAGTIRLQVAGEPVRLLAPGDAFHEPAGAEVPHFDNASETEPATFIAHYLLPPGEERLIEMLGDAASPG